ncbi:MAG: hypothetical protein KF901_12610 [Myxococcales bacterium]|nr:hypothetical protein [Myxococcales bacterium]
MRSPLVVGDWTTLRLDLTLIPPAGAAPSLRALSLGAPTRAEPDGQWADGTPVSAHAAISPDQAEAIARVLTEEGFFERASHHHSERRRSPTTPAPEGTAGLPPTAPGPHVRVTVATHDDDWHRYRILDLDWGAPARGLLERLRAHLGGEPTARLDELLHQLPD